MSRVLIAVEHRERAHVVGTYATPEAAQAAWDAADDARRRTDTPMTELFYAVRDDEDPIDPTVALLHRQPEPVVESLPEKPKRRQTRMVADVKMVSQGDGHWVSEDGEYEIQYVDDYETECDEPHPVRISRGMRDGYLAEPAHRRRFAYPIEMQYAIADGKKGYMCPGGETHYYGLWEVGGKRVVVIGRSDTFAGAASMLEEYLQTGKTFE